MLIPLIRGFRHHRLPSSSTNWLRKKTLLLAGTDRKWVPFHDLTTKRPNANMRPYIITHSYSAECMTVPQLQTRTAKTPRHVVTKLKKEVEPLCYICSTCKQVKNSVLGKKVSRLFVFRNTKNCASSLTFKLQCCPSILWFHRFQHLFYEDAICMVWRQCFSIEPKECLLCSYWLLQYWYWRWFKSINNLVNIW